MKKLTQADIKIVFEREELNNPTLDTLIKTKYTDKLNYDPTKRTSLIIKYTDIFYKLNALFPKDINTVLALLPSTNEVQNNIINIEVENAINYANELLDIVLSHVDNNLLTLNQLGDMTNFLSPLFYKDYLKTKQQLLTYNTINHEYAPRLISSSNKSSMPHLFNVTISDTCSNIVYLIKEILLNYTKLDLDNLRDQIRQLPSNGSFNLNIALNCHILLSINKEYTSIRHYIPLAEPFDKNQLLSCIINDNISENSKKLILTLSNLTTLSNCSKCKPITSPLNRNDKNFFDETFYGYLDLVLNQVPVALWKSLTIDKLYNLSMDIINLYDLDYQKELLNPSSEEYYLNKLKTSNINQLLTSQLKTSRVYGVFPQIHNLSECVTHLLELRKTSTVEIKTNILNLVEKLLLISNNRYSEFCAVITACNKLRDLDPTHLQYYLNNAFDILTNSSNLRDYNRLNLEDVMDVLLFTKPNEPLSIKDYTDTDKVISTLYCDLYGFSHKDEVTKDELATDFLRLLKPKIISLNLEEFKKSRNLGDYTMLILLGYPIEFLRDLGMSNSELELLIQEVAWNLRLAMSKEYVVDNLPKETVFTAECLLLILLHKSYRLLDTVKNTLLNYAE